MEDRYLSSPLKELCSPAGTEGWDLIIANNLLRLLPTRSHPKAYGHLFIGTVVAAQQVVQLGSPDGLCVVTLVPVFHGGVPPLSSSSGSFAPSSFLSLYDLRIMVTIHQRDSVKYMRKLPVALINFLH